MNNDDCLAMLDNPEGNHGEALDALLNHTKELTGLISRLTLPHLQPLQTAIHKVILHMVAEDVALQEELITAFIDATNDIQEALMPVMAQLGAHTLMLAKISQACMNERDAERGQRFFNVMTGCQPEWHGAEGLKIREKLKESHFVHRTLCGPKKWPGTESPRHLTQMVMHICSKHWND